MDPVKLSQQVLERYRRYLRTSFYFRDPVLRSSFEQALESDHLAKGPYLEATPVFKPARTPRELFPTLVGSKFDEGFLRAVQGDRPLYLHQEQAIERVLGERNVIVATGTGSGKTEAFLFPILLHLYREFVNGSLCPGVRALILYPMNALANDQRERLADIRRRLEAEHSPFRFTFGQYIGETPDDERDSSRHAQEHLEHRLPGELVLRSEIRSTPPHILLTNYSMLEYLLLRPADSPLFDDGQAKWWTFLVLDEAHQYRGSRGIEMGMLLRRFKQRLREGGCSRSLRCIATSATLIGAEADKPQVAAFASDLFGEEFLTEDVILGETELIRDAGPVRLAAPDYGVLECAIDGQPVSPDLNRLMANVDLVPSPRLGQAQLAGEILLRDQRTCTLRRFLKDSPVPVDELADGVFEDEPASERIGLLSRLVGLLLRARDPQSGSPLLSARYHLFLRSLEGAFVQFVPEKKILLDRKSASDKGVVFELALCRECGQHYLVAQKGFKRGKIAEAIRDPSHDYFGATFLRPLEADEEANEEEGDAGAERREIYYLCLRCGEISNTPVGCGHGQSIRVVRESSKDDDRADQIERCGTCGYSGAGRDPVREIVYGTDGPHAVIATTLFQKLDRKKVLAFADGRQEAAYFAWYLDHSYQDLLSRNTVLRVARSYTKYPEEGLSLGTISDRAFQKHRDAFRKGEADDESTIRKNIWRALYREFLTDEQRLSLEGLGLVKWCLLLPRWIQIPKSLLQPPWSLEEVEARNVVALLLDTMRRDRAVELATEEDVALAWNDLDLQAGQRSFCIGQPRGRVELRSWDGKRGRRVQFLCRLMQGQAPNSEIEQQAITALRAIWEALRQGDEEAPSSQDRLLIQAGGGCRINPRWWRLHVIQATDSVYQCDICNRVQPIPVRGLCAQYHCPGKLKEISSVQLEPNHYRQLYQDDLPNTLVVEEHTAQLDHTKAREFQRRFRDGKIHVLSCSTTFELGVDLGDLDTAFLRNVPPESFNYAQRVGRVGRRSGQAGYAITYCRRSPHDLYHFGDPRQMLAGRVQPPALSLRNAKIISRHVTAMALSAFFREHPERFNTVTNFCGNLLEPAVMADLRTFLSQSRSHLEDSLRAILPQDMVNEIGLVDGTWVDRIAGETSHLAFAIAEISSDYQILQRRRTEAFSQGDDRTVKWAGDRARAVESEDVLSFLSRKAVIPKYGFPVDVVELDTQRTLKNQEAFEVALQRDLTIAISEFAPTSELVANKKMWTSYGLKKVLEKEWERWWYARCPVHARFQRVPYQNEKAPPEFNRCCEKTRVALQYVEPRFGFITGRDKSREPRSRPNRIFTTRPYFVGFKDKEGEPIDLGVVKLTKVSPGSMVVVCEGRRGEGFYICSRCGAGFRQRKDFAKGHTTPYGDQCPTPPGSLRAVSLGHELVTDVLKLEFRPVSGAGVDPTWFAFGLGYALVEGAAEMLNVPSTDLNATVAFGGDSPIAPIILYDNVPGGAGLVARLEEKPILVACMQAASKRVSGNCGCGEDTSCYGCLRNYRNQFAHQYLQRGPVMTYLETVLSSLR